MPREEDIAIFTLWYVTTHGPATLQKIASEASEHFRARVTSHKISLVISVYELPLRTLRFRSHIFFVAPKELSRVLSYKNVRGDSMSGVISIEEFEQLLEKTSFGRGKVSTEEIIEYLSDKAATTQEIANHFGVKPVSMLSRLKKLLEKGLVRCKTDGKRYYWTSAGVA